MYQKRSSLQEEVITLSNAEETDSQIKIQDEGGNWYSFFKFKQNGAESQAYDAFQKLQFGAQVKVVFEEKTGSKGGKFRNVAMLKPPEDSPARPLAPKGPVAQPPTTVSPMHSKDDMIACLALMKVAGVSLEALEDPTTWKRFLNAVHTGKKVIAGGSVVKSAPVQQPVAAQQTPDNSTTGDDINVEDIPF